MNKIRKVLLLMAIIGVLPVSYAQNITSVPDKNAPVEKVDHRIDNMGYWMKMAEKGLVPYNASVPVKPAEYKGSQITYKGAKVIDSPDVPVTDLTNVAESENSVFIDPDNNQYVLNSNNSSSWNGGIVTEFYGCSYFQTGNAGSTWGGSPLGAGGYSNGDPTTAIGRDGRQFINYIGPSVTSQGISYSDNGTTWSTATVSETGGVFHDKNHMWIDNSLTSPYEGNLYVAWTEVGGTYDYRVVLCRSTNNGVTWSTKIPVSHPSSYFSHGVNLQTGPNGQVYACWATYQNNSMTEKTIGFNKSANGGVSFGTATNAISNIKGIRETGVMKTMRVNSFPVMAVDISGGPNNGTIYIVWTNIGTPGINSGTNKSVYIIKSTNGGTTWSTPVRVNQGPFANGKEAYIPWITCDVTTGALAVIFYDDRNTSPSSCETWVAYSTDAGSTWADFRVSDVSFTPNPIPGMAGGYMGDYLGITSKDGMVYPCWTDTRNGLYMTYVSPFNMGLNAYFTVSDQTVCTGTSVTFTDQSSGPPTSWSWSFPGGTPATATGAGPHTITYNTPGIYDVSLTVADGSGTDTETRTGYITVQNVFADFSGTPTTVAYGGAVTFTDNSSCSPTAWSWSFPGGTPATATGAGPHVITYNTEGTYDVSLTVTKGGSNDTELKTGYITVLAQNYIMTNGTVTTCSGTFTDSGGPSGNYGNEEIFTETFYPSTPNSNIRFTFNTFNTEATMDFLFIYDGSSTAAPMIGEYHGSNSPGIVTATNPEGALTFRFMSDVENVAAGWFATISCVSTIVPPVADFSASNTTPTNSTPVTFTDLSDLWPTSWSWDFSPNTVTYVGGTSSTSQNPQVQFNVLGYYTVTLTATNAYGSDSEVKTDYIDVIYCFPTSNPIGGTEGDYISLVQLGSINNATGALPPPAYIYYDAMSTNLIAGYEYTITLSPGTISGSNVAVWIDYNQNGVFDPAEKLGNIPIPPKPATGTITFTVPANAQAGTTRMRVREAWMLNEIPPCGNLLAGETEDYNVQVEMGVFGILEGYITQAAGGAPVEGAIINVGDFVSSTSGNDGYYNIQNVLVGTWNVSCSKEGFHPDSVMVTISPDITSSQDFQLTAPTIDLFPETIEVTVAPFGQATEYITIANNGDGILNWNTELEMIWDDKIVNKELKGSQAYGVKLYPSPVEVVSFDTDDPGTFNTISGATFQTFAGDFYNSSLLYVITYPTYELYAINVISGTETFIAPITGMTVGHVTTGMACDKSTGIMYVSSTNNSVSAIYTLDLTTGACTLIGNTGIPALIEIAIDGAGTMYAWDIVNDEAFTVNKTTGASTLLGPLGFDLNYAQGGNWDPLTDQIYLAAYTTSGKLMKMDKETGALSLIGNFPGGAEVDALAFPGVSGGWLSIDPQSGIVNPGNSGQMTVSFDAANLLPGVYEAIINFYSYPDVGSPVVYVTMTVEGFIPPVNLDAGFICTDVELTWEMPAGGTPDSWNVYRDGALLGNTTEMTYTDEMVDPEVAYGYYVKAVYAGEESQPTATETITVPVPEDLEALGLEATANVPSENDVTLNWDAPDACLAPDGYDIYRNGFKINASLVTALTYVDPALEIGLYEYYIVAVYYFGESDPSNPVSTVITGIEDVNSDMFKIYPNPVSGMIYIESSIGMTGIQVINNAGQVVLDKIVDVSQYKIDVAKYEKGVYYIKIETADGSKLRKITVN